MLKTLGPSGTREGAQWWALPWERYKGLSAHWRKSHCFRQLERKRVHSETHQSIPLRSPSQGLLWGIFYRGLTAGESENLRHRGERNSQLSRSGLRVPPRTWGPANVHMLSPEAGRPRDSRHWPSRHAPHYRRPGDCCSCHQYSMSTFPQKLQGMHKGKTHHLKNKHENQSDMAGVLELSNQRILEIVVNMLRVSWTK